MAAQELQPLERLKCLKLDGNRLTDLPPSAFANQPGLRTLNLARNALTVLPEDSLTNLKNLSVLNLGYNKLQRVDGDAFADFSETLERLVLSGNRLLANVGVLKGILVRVSALVDLQLSDVGLTELSYELVPGTVVSLNLAGNHLTYVPVGALPANLSDLDVSRNHLRGLGEEVVQRLESIGRLKLDSNPWSCDLCHIVPMLERINRSQAMHDVKCATPYSQAGRVLGTVKRAQLNWCSAPSFTSGDANLFLDEDGGRIGIIAASASAILLALTVLAVLGALCYARRHAANYYTHEEKRAPDSDAIVDHSPLFGEDRELSFKFPLEQGERKVAAIATIDEIKRDHALVNGT